MLLKEKTIKGMGFDPDNLSKNSNKRIFAACDYCGEEYNPVYRNYINGRSKLSKDCCGSCKHKKREEISLKKHGVKNAFQRADVKEKIKATCLEKYGTEHANQNNVVKQKIADTMEQKYGGHIAQSPLIREKYKETCLEKYGVENASQVAEFKEKRKQTNQEKYGHEYYVASEHCKNRVKEKYGVNNVFQLESVKNKIIETNQTKYGHDHYLQQPEVAKEHGQKVRQRQIDLGVIKTYDGLTQSDWSEKIGVSKSYFSVLVNTHGWDHAINFVKGKTNIEQIVENYLQELAVEYDYNKKLSSYYPDFIVGNLIIECDGLYWHSDAVQEDDNYHYNKRAFYNSMGYKSLFFRSDEIENKTEIVKSIIRNRLGLSNKIHARKCGIVDVGSKIGAAFFGKHHLMGRGRGKIYGLTNNGRLVMAIQMRRIKDNLWDVSRLCSNGAAVVGGFSKLLKHFLKQNAADRVQTFIDLRYGSGNYLSEFGFTRKTCYKSFHWTNGAAAYHRMKFPSNTGYDYNLRKIWDCGQAKYELEL